MSDSVRPHRRQPTRLPRPWDSPGKNTGVGCHFLLQCMKVKSESEVAQSCLTLRDPMDCSPPGSSVHGIFQARVLEWVPLPSLTVALFHMLATLQWAVPASEQAALLTSTPNYRKDSKYFHPQGQICLLLQVFLDFLLLHSCPL